jgi:hypothetical protein
MKKSVFIIATGFVFLIAVSSCKKTSTPNSNSILGTWVLDSTHVRDTVAGVPTYINPIQDPSTAPYVTFSSDSISTSIDPAHIENGISYYADTILENYYVSGDTIYTHAIGCGCNYVPNATYTITNNQLVQTLSNSFNPNLSVDFEVTYDSRK